MKKKNKTPIKDFTSANLPNTRKAQFKDIITHNFSKLLLLGCLLLLFAIPFFANLIINDSLCQVVLDECNKQGLDASQTYAQLLPVNIVYHSINIICFAIISIGLSGIFRVIRQMVYGETVQLKIDFLEGIKKYYKYALVSGIIFGIIVFFINITKCLFSISGNSALSIVSDILNGGLYFVFLPIMLYKISQDITYNVKYFSSIINGFKLFVSTLLVSLLFCAVIFAIQFIYIIPYILIVSLILVVICMLIPLFLLCFHLYATSVFDNNINKENYPEIYRKGLSKENNSNNE